MKAKDRFSALQEANETRISIRERWTNEERCRRREVARERQALLIRLMTQQGDAATSLAAN